MTPRSCFQCRRSGAITCELPCGLCADLCPGIEATLAGGSGVDLPNAAAPAAPSRVSQKIGGNHGD